jgi:hypothetical protein
MTSIGHHGRHAHAEPYLSAAQIRDHDLPDSPWGRRGYAKDDVRRLLHAVAGQVRSMQLDIEAAHRALEHRELEIERVGTDWRYLRVAPSSGQTRCC